MFGILVEVVKHQVHPCELNKLMVILFPPCSDLRRNGKKKHEIVLEPSFFCWFLKGATCIKAPLDDHFHQLILTQRPLLWNWCTLSCPFISTDGKISLELEHVPKLFSKLHLKKTIEKIHLKTYHLIYSAYIDIRSILVLSIQKVCSLSLGYRVNGRLFCSKKKKISAKCALKKDNAVDERTH